jgi:hypothetical protein
MKPIILAPLVAIVLAGGGVGAYLAVAGAGSGEEATAAQPAATPTPAAETPTPTPTAEADVQVIRWVNVTVAVPEDSGFAVGQTFHGLESQRPALLIIPLDRPNTSVVIDAETAAILKDTVGREDRALVGEILKTVTLSPLDREAAHWPYSGEPPDVPRQREGNITYIPPDPAAGIRITVQIGDGGGAERTSNASIHVTNGRSALGINTATGDVYWETAVLAPEDKEVFDRFLSTVQYVGP